MSAQLISHMKGLYLTKEIHAQFNRKVWHKLLSPFMSLWKKLNQSQEFIKMDVPHEELSDSIIFNFVLDEFRKAIILIHFIHKHFSNLSKAIKGSATPSVIDMGVANKLMSHEV